MTNAILERKYLTAKAVTNEEASADAPYGSVSGIANAFEVDRYGDLVLPEAMGAATAKFMQNPVLSFGHGIEGNPTDGTLPAGSVLNLTQDVKGNTIFRARWASTPDAQKVRQLYKDVDMRAFSIHFLPYGDSLETRQPTADEVARFPGVQRVITKLELIEIACAVVPVNAGSLASEAKSFTGLMRPKSISQPSTGERTMSKSILTSDMRKAIDGAKSAHEAHVKALDAVATHLEELSVSKEGAEADHATMCGKCFAAFKKSADAHAALGEAVKGMHKAITNADVEEDREGEGNEPEAGKEPDGDEGQGEGGSEPLPTEPEAKALVLQFRKMVQ